MAEAGPVPLDRFTSAVLDQRWPVIAVAGLAMLALTAGAVFIGVTNDHRVLFDEHNPHLLAYEALEETYTESDTALIALAPGASVFTRETLGLMEALTEAAWQTPHSIRVDSLTNYNHSESVEDDLAVGPLFEGAETLDEAGLARVE
ncbi:MAG: RND family transporter, partial [Gammaproteobacteria bacterium]|nr:RND family transporter [Gammaproteobacteria bacterium]